MRLLITGIGGDIAQGVATIINESRPDIELYGTDTQDSHAGSLYVKEVIHVPNANTCEYLDVMRKIVDDFSIDMVIPIPEPELSVFSPLAEELGEQKCITAGAKIIAACLDKLETMRVLSGMGVTVPWTISADEGMPETYPCIFKSRRGYGSKNIFMINDKEEAEFFKVRYPQSVFQELLEPADKEVTCAVYRSRKGAITVLQLLRHLTGGLTGWAEVICDDKVNRMCEQIAENLELFGSINIQLRLTASGPRIFEINPRFSSTVLMRHRIGFSDLLWSIEEAHGKNIEFPKIIPGQKIVRVQDAKLIK